MELETLSKIDNIIQKIENRIPEKVNVTVKTIENLNKDGKLILPLKIRGKMLGIGRHKKKFYTEEELIKAVEFHNNKRFPVKLDHRSTEVGSTIGMVNLITWDDVAKVIRYEAHINDATHARNMVDGMISEVSAGIFSEPAFNIKFGLMGKNLEFNELSVVEGGKFEGNSLETVL